MKMNKPILAFIIDDNVSVEKNFIESDEKKKKLEKFKEKVQKDRMIEKWNQSSCSFWLRISSPQVFWSPVTCLANSACGLPPGLPPRSR